MSGQITAGCFLRRPTAFKLFEFKELRGLRQTTPSYCSRCLTIYCTIQFFLLTCHIPWQFGDILVFVNSSNPLLSGTYHRVTSSGCVHWCQEFRFLCNAIGSDHQQVGHSEVRQREVALALEHLFAESSFRALLRLRNRNSMDLFANFPPIFTKLKRNLVKNRGKLKFSRE